MGIKGLWRLLLPIGRRISIETLEGQILAIDASIWLTQFLKAATRDPETGQVVHEAAHLRGFFRRICRLRFHGIRPVFVFDGTMPEIKRRELEQRRKRRDQFAIVSDEGIQRLAKKLLTEKLMKASLKQTQLSCKAAATKAFTPGFVPGDGELSTTTDAAIDSSNEKSENECIDPPIESNTPTNDEDSDHQSKEDSDTVFDDVLDRFATTQSNDFDIDLFSNLPPNKRKAAAEEAQRLRRLEARKEFMPAAADPLQFSAIQVSNFLKSCRLNKDIYAAAHQATQKGLTDHAHASNYKTSWIELIDETDNCTSCDRNVSLPIVEESIYLRGDTYQEMESSSSSSSSSSSFRAASLMKSQVNDSICETIDGNDGNKYYYGYSVDRADLDERETLSIKSSCSSSSGEVENLVSDKDGVRPSDCGDTGTLSSPLLPSPSPCPIQYSRLNDDPAICNRQKHSNIDCALQSEEYEEDESVDWESGDDSPDPIHDNCMADKSPDPNNESDIADESPNPNHLTGSDFDGERYDASSSALNGTSKSQLVTANHPHSPSMSLLKDSECAIERLKDDDSTSTLRKERIINSTETERCMNKSMELNDDLEKAEQILLSNDDPSNDGHRFADISTPVNETRLNGAAGIDVWDAILQRSPEDSTSAALERGLSTASNLTNWAGVAFRKAMKATGHVASKSSFEAPPITAVHVPGGSSDIDSGVSSSSLQKSARAVDYEANNDYYDEEENNRQWRKEKQNREKNIDSVTDDMREDVIELLHLFGIPYIESTAEAESQCAALEEIGIVHGIITEDSDVFAFGGKTVYRNFFDEQKYAEVYKADDAAREMRLGRNEMVALALLLGGDYTEGVRGVGIVNAMEVLEAFSMSDGVKNGLMEFKKWLDCVDLPNNIIGSSLNEKQLNFHENHRTAKTRWVLPEGFPSDSVLHAYLCPVVDKSTESFTWGQPDVDNLFVYGQKKMGWNVDETKKYLDPVFERLETRGLRQTRLDAYMKYEDGIQFANIRSKRLREVLRPNNPRDASCME